MTKGDRTTQRDRPDTSLSRLLRVLWDAHEQVIAAVLVDAEGECVDYCTSGDPYDAKVMAATWLDTTMGLRRAGVGMGARELRQWTLESEAGGVVVRRVTEEHFVVLQLSTQGVNARLLLALDALVIALRADVGADRGGWDPQRDPWLGRRSPA